MQMQHVRMGRAPQVPVPPVSAAPLEISREARQQLRVTRHRAFERHQENAQWTKELLGGCEAAGDGALVTPRGLSASAQELQKQIEAQKQAGIELEKQLAQKKESKEAEQRRFEEMLAMLKTAGDATALKECQKQVEAEKSLLLNGRQRKMELVRL